MLRIQLYYGRIVKDYPGRCYAQGLGSMFQSWEKTLGRDDAFAFYHWLYRERFHKEWIPHDKHRQYKGRLILIVSFAGGGLLGEEEFFVDGAELAQTLREGKMEDVLGEFYKQGN